MVYQGGMATERMSALVRKSNSSILRPTVVLTVIPFTPLHSLPILISTVTSVGATTIASDFHRLETAAWNYHDMEYDDNHLFHQWRWLFQRLSDP